MEASDTSQGAQYKDGGAWEEEEGWADGCAWRRGQRKSGGISESKGRASTGCEPATVTRRAKSPEDDGYPRQRPAPDSSSSTLASSGPISWIPSDFDATSCPPPPRSRQPACPPGPCLYKSTHPVEPIQLFIRSDVPFRFAPVSDYVVCRRLVTPPRLLQQIP